MSSDDILRDRTTTDVRRVSIREVPVSDPDVPRAVGRAFELLELVVATGEVNLTTAAQRTGLTPTTALRHLRALEALGYVHRDRDGVYSAGPAVLRLAAVARGGGPLARLVSAAQPVLDELTAATGESSYLAVAEADRALYLATSESPRSIRHVGWVGRTVPLATTAVGAALLGAPGPQHRTDTIEPDIAAVAHAVTDTVHTVHGPGEVVAALSVIGPAHRMDAAAVAVAGAALARAADQLATVLGLHAPSSSPSTASPPHQHQDRSTADERQHPHRHPRRTRRHDR